MNQNDKVVKVAVAGANGRMGIELLKESISSYKTELVEACVRSSSAIVGQNIDVLFDAPIKNANLVCSSQSLPLKESTEVLIDFTLPDNTLENIQRCIEGNKALIIGTTGFSTEQQNVINQASSKIAILQASNMSIGVNLTLALLKQTSAVLGADINVRISETHHIHKKDSPSGTAITMGEVIANSNNKKRDDCMVYEGNDELQSESGKITFKSIREGEVIGDHTVSFIMDDEIIEISHRAINRKVFAKGAIKAAIWLSDKEPGFYSMNDVLGLK